MAVPAGADLTYRTWYDIEAGYDYGFVDVSDDDGATWDNLESYTGTDTDHWADTRTLDLSAYEGKNVLIRFEYVTDGGVAPLGWEITDVEVGGSAVAAGAFSSDGWVRCDGQYSQLTERYYIAEYRTWRRLRREPQGLLPVERRLRQLGRPVRLQPRPAPDLP